MLKRSASRIKEPERGCPHEVRAPDGWLRRNDLAGVVERNEQIEFTVIRMNFRRPRAYRWIGPGPIGEREDQERRLPVPQIPALIHHHSGAMDARHLVGVGGVQVVGAARRIGQDPRIADVKIEQVQSRARSREWCALGKGLADPQE